MYMYKCICDGDIACLSFNGSRSTGYTVVLRGHNPYGCSHIKLFTDSGHERTIGIHGSHRENCASEGKAANSV